MAATPPEDVHIRLDQPKGLRKQFLESALSSSEFLQIIGRIQTFEQERLVLKTTFTNAMTDLSVAMQQFTKTLPPIPAEFIQKQEQIIQRQLKSQQQPTRVLTPRQELANRMQPSQPTPSFLSPLEEEMAELKRKIKNLEI